MGQALPDDLLLPEPACWVACRVLVLAAVATHIGSFMRVSLSPFLSSLPLLVQG